MSDSVGLHDVRRFHVHDAGKRRQGQRAADAGRSAAPAAATATAASEPATATTTPAPAQPATAAPTTAAPATATVAVPAGPQRQAQSADGRKVVEDHRRPEHPVPGQLDQAG